MEKTRCEASLFFVMPSITIVFLISFGLLDRCSFFFDLKVQSVLKIRLLQKEPKKGFSHNSPTPLRPKRGFNLSLNPFPIIGKGLN